MHGKDGSALITGTFNNTASTSAEEDPNYTVAKAHVNLRACKYVPFKRVVDLSCTQLQWSIAASRAS